MTFSIIVMIMFVLAVIATLPFWPYSRGWGFGTSTALGLVTAVVLINATLARRPGGRGSEMRPWSGPADG